MTPRAKKALEGSIRKWERVLTGDAEDRGNLNCPLCKLFNNDRTPDDKRCIGCPVEAKTKRDACAGTPYVRWLKVGGDVPHGWAYSNPARRAALAMLRFLESLR